MLRRKNSPHPGPAVQGAGRSSAAGVSATLQLALEIVRPGGQVTKVGWGPQPYGASLDPLVQKGVTLQGSYSHNWPMWEKVIAMLASEQWPSWYWLMLIPIAVLQTMFNVGAALIVARLGGSLADISELIPFFLRISRYFCGVMYLTFTITYRFHHDWIQQVLSLNPFAVYISLFRVAFMSSYRQDMPGNAPFNADQCAYFMAHQGQSIPGTTTPDFSWLASCQAVVTNNDLWIAAIGWGVVFFVVGIVFFWQAENKYGRG